MAEIKIKKKSPVWPWIILILVIVAGLAYYFMVYEKTDMDGDRPNTEQEKLMENGTGAIFRTSKKVSHSAPAGAIS